MFSSHPTGGFSYQKDLGGCAEVSDNIPIGQVSEWQCREGPLTTLLTIWNHTGLCIWVRWTSFLFEQLPLWDLFVTAEIVFSSFRTTLLMWFDISKWIKYYEHKQIKAMIILFYLFQLSKIQLCPTGKVGGEVGFIPSWEFLTGKSNKPSFSIWSIFVLSWTVHTHMHTHTS